MKRISKEHAELLSAAVEVREKLRDYASLGPWTPSLLLSGMADILTRGMKARAVRAPRKPRRQPGEPKRVRLRKRKAS